MQRISLKGLILAGGFATRLRPLSCSKPKLLFPIVGQPLVELMASWLCSGGVKQIILAVNHFSDKLRAEIAQDVGGVTVAFSVEEMPLGTAGPIRLAADLLSKDDPFFVVNGDIVSDIDVRGMLALHEEKEADVTIALVSVPDPSPYGSVLTHSNGTVKKFEEKSGVVSPGTLVNAGVYVLSPRLINSIPVGRSTSLESDIFPRLAENGRMQAWKHDGFWYDIGRIPEYVRSNKELLQKRQVKAGELMDHSHDGIEIVRPAHLGSKSRLGVGAKIGPLTILSENVTVGNAAEVRNSIVFEDTTIGEKSFIEDAVIGERVVIGRETRIGRGSIVAGQITIPAGSEVPPDSVILY